MIEPPPSTITLFLYILHLFLTLFDKLVILGAIRTFVTTVGLA